MASGSLTLATFSGLRRPTKPNSSCPSETTSFFGIFSPKFFNLLGGRVATHHELCCACWRLMSNMKIGTAAGKYSKCIVLGPFKTEPQQKEKRHQSASVNSHSAPVFFCFVMVWETKGGVPHFIP